MLYVLWWSERRWQRALLAPLLTSSLSLSRVHLLPDLVADHVSKCVEIVLGLARLLRRRRSS